MLSFIKIILSLEFWKSFLFPLNAPHPHPKPFPGRGPKVPSLTRKAAAGQSSWPEQRAVEAVGKRVVGVWRGLPRPPHYPPPRGTQVPELPEERMEDSATVRSGRSESPGGAGGGRGGVGGKGWAAPSPSLAYPPIPPSPLPARLPGHPGGGGSSGGARALHPRQWTQPRSSGRSARPADW